MFYRFLITAVAVLTAFTTFATGSYEADFGEGKWNKSEWEMVKSSRSGYIGEWVQHKDKLVNKVPAGVDPKTYKTSNSGSVTAMLLKKEYSGDITVELECGFEYRMAPGIIISTVPLRPGEKSVADLPMHLEVILYDHGLNVWYHFFDKDVQKWYKAVHFFEEKVFAPGKPHRLIFRIVTRKGKRFAEVSCNGKSAGGLLPVDFPDKYRVGIVASEGVNFFHSIKVIQP